MLSTYKWYVIYKWLGYVQAYHCRNQSIEEAVNKLRQFFAQYGFCSSIGTDSGPALQAKMGDLGVQINHSSAYHPASNGFAERGIKTVKDQLKKHEPNTFI